LPDLTKLPRNWNDLDDIAQKEVENARLFVPNYVEAGYRHAALSRMKKVACHPTLLHFLSEWRTMSAHASDSNWIFPSLKMRGAIPMSHDGRRFGLHSFRSSLATWMVSVAKTDLKTAQGSLRHANPQILLDRYARSVTVEMIAAQGRFLEECGMDVEHRLLPEPATDRIESVGA
jgi:hypothetical protein